MANVQVVNSTTNTQAVRRTRYEKMETAFGKILAAQYAVGDTLIFNKIPSKEIIHVSLAGATKGKEMYYGTDFSAAVAFDINNSSATADLYYTISYIRGTGRIDDSVVEKGEGQILKVTVASS